MHLQEKIINLPSSPGVYLMKDSQGSIIYVGKAKNLKKRVQSYFRNSNSYSPKVKRLVMHLKDFDYILCDTEFEAFMLECQLIKEIKPMYNRMMKNPQSFIYIMILHYEGNRTIEVTHGPIKNDGNLYFGPYPNRNTVEKAIHGLKDSFKLNCSNPSKKNTACLNYSLGLCLGKCLGGSAVEEYDVILDKVVALLNGTDLGLLKEMEQLMYLASESFDFKTAAKIRDDIDAVNSLLYKENVIAFTEDNHNLVIIEYLNDSTVKLFLINRTQILFNEKYIVETIDTKQLSKTIRNYFKKIEPQSFIEVSKYEIDEAQIIYSYLKSNNCKYFIVPGQWLNSENSDNMDKELYNLLALEKNFKYI